MTEKELKRLTKQIEAILEDADHSAANDDLRRALYHTTSAITVLLSLVNALAQAVVVQS